MNKFIYQLIRFEFWPWWAMYLPMIPIYLFGVLKTRKWLYFTAVNPTIDMGGFFGEKKEEIQRLIPSEYTTDSKLIRSTDELIEYLKSARIDYPVIAKPNVGERGKGVVLIQNEAELKTYSERGEEFIIQEYCEFPIELSALFVKLPGHTTQITSLAEKEFLTVFGDGKSTVEQLLLSDERNQLYHEVLMNEHIEKARIIPGKGEAFVVHTIGNHTKGTRFINANDNISEKLSKQMAQIADAIEGVYYGRLDMKIKSYLNAENGLDIKIFEMNGVSSEPSHIYGLPNVIMAYEELARHWHYLITIAKSNIKKGVQTTPFSYFIRQVTAHFS